MHLLLIEDRANAETPFLSTLEAVTSDSVVKKVPSLQEGIEALELPEAVFDMVVCDYHGSSSLLLGALLGLVTKIPCVICVDSDESRNALLNQFPRSVLTAILTRPQVQTEFPKTVQAFVSRGELHDLQTQDADFVPVKPEVLIQSSAVTADVYLRLAPNKYCKLFRKGDVFDSQDLARYRDQKKIEYFHLKKEEFQKFLGKQYDDVNALVSAPDAPAEALEERASLALESLHTIVERVGFTEEAQQLAKTSAQVTLKLIGSRPQLSAILARLNQNKGQYITAHSVALAQVACALAHRIGWKSAPTYLKLSLAAYLHDLPLKNNLLARCSTLEEARQTGFSEEELRQFKMHPILAAEYALEFHEIPSDIDLILMQHHERPDGSGFPRGLMAGRISPLSSLFIIAHDLLNFSLGEGAGYPDQFFVLKGDDYDSGHFKKIVKALQSGAAADADG